jgi:2-polyprenyl-6-methoxyphenol hydroxylase-like FAD-dependent oxidoreductase
MSTDAAALPARAQVLVVGAGPVGLALAIELGHRGIGCLVVERHDRVGHAARAKTTNVRTREHLRRWGIADRLRAASPLGLDYPSNVVFCTRLSGPELTRFENANYCAPGRNPLYSEHGQWVPQYTLEQVLRAHAQSLPSVRLRFGTELAGFEQDAEGVHARLRDVRSGEVQAVQADFLVGADGARSGVREAIGAKLTGEYGLSRHYNIVFRAPGLAHAHRHGPAIMYWQVNGESPSLLGPMDQGDTWFFMPTQVGEGLRPSDPDAKGMIARATGIDLPYEVVSVDEWVASRLIADRYRDRHVFLAGDACHLHPPFGGYGMNMGIADGVDLGWKLAAVLQGWGGEALLASYEAERRPVHQWVLDEAMANHAVLSNHLAADGIEDKTADGAALRQAVGARIQAAKLREFATLGVVLGYHYDGSPVVVPDGTPRPAADHVNLVPTSRPGHLAPHAWRHDGSSLYDHFGHGFTLLLAPGAPTAQAQAALHDAKASGVRLTLLQPHEGGIGALYPRAFTLIRPDQHVAWRGDAWPADGVTLLHRVTGRSVSPHHQEMS